MAMWIAQPAPQSPYDGHLARENAGMAFLPESRVQGPCREGLDGPIR